MITVYSKQAVSAVSFPYLDHMDLANSAPGYRWLEDVAPPICIWHLTSNWEPQTERLHFQYSQCVAMQGPMAGVTVVVMVEVIWVRTTKPSNKNFVFVKSMLLKAWEWKTTSAMFRAFHLQTIVMQHAAQLWLTDWVSNSCCSVLIWHGSGFKLTPSRWKRSEVSPPGTTVTCVFDPWGGFTHLSIRVKRALKKERTNKMCDVLLLSWFF